jgi:hypothetical protein
MTSIRVTAQGPTQLTGAALLPVPALPSRGGRGLIHGNPSQPIPAPRQGGLPNDRTALAIGGHDSRTSDAPAYWTTAQYFIYGRQAATPPVSVTSDNQMPIPARDARGTVAPWTQGRTPPTAGAFWPPRVGTQRQVVQPKVTTRFPDIMGRGPVGGLMRRISPHG